MAKSTKSARRTKQQEEPKADLPPQVAMGKPADPSKVHELFGVPGPHEPPNAPRDMPGYATFWDCGVSVMRVKEKYPNLFFPDDWYDKQPFARQTDVRKWRQIRLTPVLPGKPAAEQLAKLPKGDDVASARELVVFLALRVLTTNERPEVGSRCRDVLPSGRRVIVSFGPFGFSLGSMAESWGSPTFGLAAVFTPRK